MSKIVSYKEFCQRYSLDESAPESKTEYKKYVDSLVFFDSLKDKTK